MSSNGLVNTYSAIKGDYSTAELVWRMHATISEEIEPLIQQWYKGYAEKPSEAINMLLPYGWVWLSAGKYRCAYMAPDGTVYKVNRSLCDGQGMGLNYSEMMNILRLNDHMPKGFAIPDSSLYCVPGINGMGSDYVLAMSLVDTSAPFNDCNGDDAYDPCYCEFNEGSKRVYAMCSSTALAPLCNVMIDIHSGNAFPDESGIIWVVDIAI